MHRVRALAPRRVARIIVSAHLLIAAPAAAQELTVERIYASEEFRTRGAALDFHTDGESVVVYETQGDVVDVWLEGIRTGERERVIEGRLLVPEGGSTPISLESVTFNGDRSRALIFANSERVWRLNTLGEYYVLDMETGRLTPVSTAGKQMFAKLSPDGTKVGFVRDNNLFVRDLRAGTETRLTTDGSVDIINGTTDWVYEEELGLRDAWRWSPDGSRIAYWRFDQSPVDTFYMIDGLELYSELVPLRYPKAGTENSSVQIRVVNIADGATSTITQVDGDSYLPRMDWMGEDALLIQRMNRHQNRLEVLRADTRSGEVATMFVETDSAWVDVDDDLIWFDDGQRFLWSSERDGWNHLYVYGRDGGVQRQLTEGEWDVASVIGVDERGGFVYFTAARPTPMELHLFRVPLGGGRIEKLTEEPGSHYITMSPGFTYYVDTWSRASEPPTTRLFSTDGRLTRTLAENSAVAARVDGLGLQPPEFFQFETTDGVTLNGWMIKPADFDPSRQYAALLYVYGGPGSQTVTDSWGGSRYLWHQLLAERGIIVVSVDNRGTGARGRDFKKVTYLNLGEYETRDQAEAARWLAAQSYIDPDRIGIWGWSYGGYMTALSMMNSDRFAAGVSVAPVTDWRLYDTIYTERFMRTPQENPGGYDNSPVHKADDLNGALLLIHGTGDDNVHFQNTVQLANALQAADKQFDLMIYPNRTHSISGGNTTVHLFTLITDWLVEKLADADRPAS